MAHFVIRVKLPNENTLLTALDYDPADQYCEPSYRGKLCRLCERAARLFRNSISPDLTRVPVGCPRAKERIDELVEEAAIKAKDEAIFQRRFLARLFA
jgi:hypothetical protein